MGAKTTQNSEDIAAAEAKLEKANADLKLDLAQAAIDVAGIVDPTPISDVTGAALSLYRGDLIGAGLSLISIIPYAGDALAKTAKGARLAKQMAVAKKRIEAAIALLKRARAARHAARIADAAAVRAKRAAEAAKKFAEAKKCKGCRKPTGNKFGSISPKEGKNGSWDGGEKGNSEWHPDPDTKTGQKVLDATGGKPVEYKDGYPVFTPHAQARVEIDMKGNSTDFKAARDAMRKQRDDPKWPGGKRDAPKDWTWHHHEDGVTMELVPSNLNNNVSHTGGDSIVNEIKKDPGY
jgi:hypothetical protein